MLNARAHGGTYLLRKTFVPRHFRPKNAQRTDCLTRDIARRAAETMRQSESILARTTVPGWAITGSTFE